MNNAVISRVPARRAPDLKSEQLAVLMQKLHAHAGISIDSTKNVIAGCIQARMKYLGIHHVESYLATFDDSINARAEWLALIELLTVKDGKFAVLPR